MGRWGGVLDARHGELLSIFLQKLQCSMESKPNHQVFADLLKSCATVSAIKLGKALHGYVAKLGHLSCQSVTKAVLNMYAKCGAFDNCRNLFNETGHSDPVGWNIFLSGLSGSSGFDAQVMSMFNAMHIHHEPKPNSVTIAIILPVCARLQDLYSGKSVHGYVIKRGLDSQALVGNALLSMYAKCGLVDTDACAAFHEICYKDIISWNAMIAGFAENMYVDDALRLFHWMLKRSIEPNYSTIANILPVCSFFERNAACCFGKEIHCYALRRRELAANVFVCNSLVSFYLRIGHTEDAEILFQNMESKDVISWNAIVAGYASNGLWLKAFESFEKLVTSNSSRPDPVTLISILPVCAHLHYYWAGKKIHGYILRHSGMHNNTAVNNALVSFYEKSNNVNAAFKTFGMILKKDIISWNTMLDALEENKYENEFVDLLHWMLKEGPRPDSITILSIINLCAVMSRMDKLKEIHSYSVKAGCLLHDIDPTLGNAILDAYAKCNNIEYATRMFKSLSVKGNVVSCNSMISGYLDSGLYSDAHMVFRGMTGMDLTTLNLMIRVYAENNCSNQALVLFGELQVRGMKPDAMTIVSILQVCAKMASVHLLRQLHGYIIRACFEDLHLKGTLLDVYSKCGAINCAHTLFQSSPHKDVVMFTAMVGGYAMHGMGKDALRVYYDMLALGLKPDHVILTTILSACSHAGLLDEGWEIFETIEKIHHIKPTMEQYSCVVDLLARGGQIKDAYSFIARMPVEADANVWGTLLGACKTHHDVELGRHVANHLFRIEADNMGSYVLMSNLYASDERWDGVVEIRRLMRTKDMKKPFGCSWIEVEGKNNTFIAGDSSHPHRSIIYGALRNLDQQMKQSFEF